MSLKTYEYLFLYAINPETNKIYLSARASIDYGISGALIYELMKSGNVIIENNELSIKEIHPENETLKTTVNLIKKINKKSVRKNTSRIANKITTIKESLINDLVTKEIIKLNEGKFLGIFQYNSYQITNNSILKNYAEVLKSTIKGEITATNNEVMLLNLIEACGLTKKVFTKKAERKIFKDWLKTK